MIALAAARHGRHVYGIRFANEKAAGTDRERPIRWLSPMASRLARQLIAEQEEEIARKAGRPGREIQSLTRSPIVKPKPVA